MMEMEIDSIRVSLMNYQRVVILKEKGSDRYLPIWIGSPEADAIVVKLQDVSVPRPMTHDLLFNMVSALRASIEHVVVSGLDHDTYFAKISIALDGKSLQIDSRPSDAIALAVRAKVPIFADETLMEKVGVRLDSESGGAIVGSDDVAGQSGGSQEPPKPVDKEELEKLSAFEEFIESLDMGGLGDDAGQSNKND